jgi:hypothetical protein
MVRVRLYIMSQFPKDYHEYSKRDFRKASPEVQLNASLVLPRFLALRESTSGGKITTPCLVRIWRTENCGNTKEAARGLVAAQCLCRVCTRAIGATWWPFYATPPADARRGWRRRGPGGGGCSRRCWSTAPAMITALSCGSGLSWV